MNIYTWPRTGKPEEQARRYTREMLFRSSGDTELHRKLRAKRKQEFAKLRAAKKPR